MAKGYLVGTIRVTDAAGYEEYRRLVPGVIAQFGGTYLVRGGAMEQLEGPPMMERVVVIEFETVAAARRFYESEAYAPVLAIRVATAVSQLAIVEGIG